MANETAKKALQDAREAIAAVNQGRVDQPSVLRFEGVRAYSARVTEGRLLTPQPPPARKRAAGR
jgi:hypothetical protein